MRTNKQKGFSLIELLIVVAIILIIAAIAIPNLLRSRMAANEASAVGSLRTLNTAAVTYSTTYGIGYPGTGTAGLAKLGPAATASSTTADLVDSVLAAGTKSGYTFTYASPVANVGYTVNASPTSPNQSGVNYFYTDAFGVIRKNATQAASVGDSPL